MRGQRSIVSAAGDLRCNDEAAGKKKAREMNRRATYGAYGSTPARRGVTHPPDARWGRWDPRRRAAIFRARNAVGERKGARFRGGGSIKEKRYTKRVRRKSSEIAHRPVPARSRPFRLPFPPVLQLSSPLTAQSSHSSDRQPTFPTSPERGHYGVTQRNTFPALNVLVCARTERRVTRVTRWEEIHD